MKTGFGMLADCRLMLYIYIYLGILFKLYLYDYMYDSICASIWRKLFEPSWNFVDAQNTRTVPKVKKLDFFNTLMFISVYDVCIYLFVEPQNYIKKTYTCILRSIVRSVATLYVKFCLDFVRSCCGHVFFWGHAQSRRQKILKDC